MDSHLSNQYEEGKESDHAGDNVYTGIGLYDTENKSYQAQSSFWSYNPDHPPNLTNNQAPPFFGASLSKVPVAKLDNSGILGYQYPGTTYALGYAATEPINQGQVGFQTHTFINPDIPLPSVELGESASADTIPSGIIPSHHSTIMTQTNMIPTSFTAAGPYFMNNDAWPQAGFGSMGGNKRKLSDQFEQASVAEKRIFTGRDESGIARGEPEIGLQQERPGSYRQATRIISAHSRHTLPPIGVFGGTRRARAHARTRNSRANLLHQQAEDTTIWAPIAGGNSPTVKTEDADLQELLGRLNKSIRSDNRIEYESGIEYPQLAFEHLEDVEPANQASQVPPAIASGNEPGLQLLPFTVEEAALFSTENLARIYEKIVATETGSNNSNGADDTVQDEPESSQAAATIAGPSSYTVAGGDNPIIRQRNAPKAFRYSAAVLKDKSCAPLAIKRRALPFGLFRPPPFTTSVGTEAVEYYMKREHGGRPRKNAASASADALATRLLNMQNKRASRDREAAIKTLCEARDNVRSFLERGGPRKFHQWIYSQLGHRHRRPAPRNSIGCHVEQRNLHAMYAAGIATGQYSTHRNGSQIPFSRAIDTNGELHAAGYLNPAEGSYKSPYLSLETPAPAQHNVNDDGTTSQLQPSETDRQDKGKGRATAATEQSYSQNYIPPPPGWEEEEVGEGEGEGEENEEGEDPAAQMFSDADMDAEGETDHEWEG